MRFARQYTRQNNDNVKGSHTQNVQSQNVPQTKRPITKRPITKLNMYHLQHRHNVIFDRTTTFPITLQMQSYGIFKCKVIFRRVLNPPASVNIYHSMAAFILNLIFNIFMPIITFMQNSKLSV